MEKKDSRSVERMQMALTRRHPDHAAAIERLIEVCERFRELCRDYLECGEVLRAARTLPQFGSMPSAQELRPRKNR